MRCTTTEGRRRVGRQRKTSTTVVRHTHDALRTNAGGSSGSGGSCVAHAAHGHGRRLRVGVVRMRGSGRGHHHGVRHGVLHCSEVMAVSHHVLSCGHQVIGNWRTLRALVVVVGVGVRGDRGGRHRWTRARAVWWRGVRAWRWGWGHAVRLGSCDFPKLVLITYTSSIQQNTYEASGP